MVALPLVSHCCTLLHACWHRSHGRQQHSALLPLNFMYSLNCISIRAPPMQTNGTLCGWEPYPLYSKAAWGCCRETASKSDLHHTFWGEVVLFWCSGHFCHLTKSLTPHNNPYSGHPQCLCSSFALMSNHLSNVMIAGRLGGGHMPCGL